MAITGLPSSNTDGGGSRLKRSNLRHRSQFRTAMFTIGSNSVPHTYRTARNGHLAQLLGIETDVMNGYRTTDPRTPTGRKANEPENCTPREAALTGPHFTTPSLQTSSPAGIASRPHVTKEPGIAARAAIAAGTTVCDCDRRADPDPFVCSDVPA